jgi:hypothetical protein
MEHLKKSPDQDGCHRTNKDDLGQRVFKVDAVRFHERAILTAIIALHHGYGGMMVMLKGKVKENFS